MPPIDPQSCSNATTSRLLGCSANTLSVLAGKGIIPREKRGRYNLCEAVPAYVAYRKGEHDATRGVIVGKGKFLEQRIRKLRLANNKTAARLIEAEVAEDTFREFHGNIVALVRQVILGDTAFVRALGKESSQSRIRQMIAARVSGFMGVMQQALDLGRPAN